MRYRYEAYSAAGTIERGVLEVDSEEVAEEVLWERDLTILSLRKELELPSKEELLPTLFGVKRQDVITFTREFATLLRAGIAVVAALQMLHEHTQKASFRQVLRKIVGDVQVGTSLSQALARHAAVFPALYLRLMEVGESTGNLEGLLSQLVTHMEKEVAIIRKIRNALAYPTLVLLLAVGVVMIMLNFVLPSLSGLYVEFGAELPLATRIVVGTAKFVQAFFTPILASAIVLGLLLWWYLRTPEGQRRRDYLMTRLPIVRQVVVMGLLSTFCRTMAILLGAGLSVTETLDLVIASSQNLRLREALQRVRTRILEGTAISGALSLENIFPTSIPQMVRVGEETGVLETNLLTMATFYEEETDRAVNRLTGSLEPALILIVGAVVMLIAVSVISPMYSIMQRIR